IRPNPEVIMKKLNRRSFTKAAPLAVIATPPSDALVLGANGRVPRGRAGAVNRGEPTHGVLLEHNGRDPLSSCGPEHPGLVVVARFSAAVRGPCRLLSAVRRRRSRNQLAGSRPRAADARAPLGRVGARPLPAVVRGSGSQPRNGRRRRAGGVRFDGAPDAAMG